jgi:hypothetical protein
MHISCPKPSLVAVLEEMIGSSFPSSQLGNALAAKLRFATANRDRVGPVEDSFARQAELGGKCFPKLEFGNKGKHKASVVA